MDVLSDLLKTIEFKSVVYFKHNFCSPWGMHVKRGKFAQFHIVVKGQCILEMGESSQILSAGDIVIFPTSAAHRILSKAGNPCELGSAVVGKIMQGESVFQEGEENTVLICGHYELDESLQHPFYDSLPEIIHINSLADQCREWIGYILDLIISETGSKAPGSASISTKLAEVLFIKVIRHYFSQNDNQNPTFLRAFGEPIISEALTLMHSQPEADWTLDNLAHKVGASRTLFINKFKNIVGKTPMKYLTNWRMIKAKELLAKTDRSILEISEEVGYNSETAFIRVFKNYYQKTPGNFRKHGKLSAQLS